MQNHQRTSAILVMLVIFFSFQSAAQEKAMVKGEAMAGASISVFSASDSSLIKLAVADSLGNFELLLPAFGIYKLEVSAIGYNMLSTSNFEVSATHPVHDFGKLEFTKSSAEMKEVTITASKRMIEVHPDKTVVNVDAGISNAGATALEVLEKSPGITVDRDGNIQLKGRQGVLVMIDGKPSYLSGPDLVNLLSSMTANQLDQIEIMTNPPAKYDAAGNSGIINIKTKKGKQRGWNGSLNLAYGQGSYFKTNNGLNLQFRNERLNVFVNYTQNANKNFNNLLIKRRYIGENGQTTGYIDQPTFLRIAAQNNTLKMGLDYYLSSKTTVGISSSGFISPRKFNSNSVGYLMDSDKVVDTTVQTRSNNRNKWVNGAINLNFRHTLNKQSELAADLDYVHYNMQQKQLFYNSITLADQSVTTDGKLRGDLPGTISIYAAKADYSGNLKGNWKIDAGLKSSYVHTDNKAIYDNEVQTVWVPDYGKTNHFLYDENINAAYISSTKKAGSWSVQGGLRFENTTYKGEQLGNPEKNDSSFKRTYNSLFPTVYVSYELDSNHRFTINTGRRIDRPAYQQLNPFLFFINEYTYQAGNPYIQPQFTWNFQASHTYKEWLTTSIEYGDTKQYFSQLFRSEGRVTILTEGNLAEMKNINLSVSVQLKPAKWWSMTVAATAIYRKVTNSGSGTDFNSENTSGNGNINNQFKFAKGWSAELSGFYNAKNQDAQFTIYGFGQVTAGIGKQILKGKGTIRLNVRDIFFSQQIKGDIRYQQVRERFEQNRDSRVATISFNWRFGKQLSDAKRRNTNSSSEEQQRVGAGG